MSSEKQVVQFLSRFRTMLEPMDYRNMIESGMSSMRERLDTFERELAIKPRRMRKTKSKAPLEDQSFGDATSQGGADQKGTDDFSVDELVFDALRSLGTSAKVAEVVDRASSLAGRAIDKAKVAASLRKLKEAGRVVNNGAARGPGVRYRALDASDTPPNNEAKVDDEDDGGDDDAEG